MLCKECFAIALAPIHENFLHILRLSSNCDFTTSRWPSIFLTLGQPMFDFIHEFMKRIVQVDVIFSVCICRCESCHGQAERLLDSAKEMEDSIAVNLRSKLLSYIYLLNCFFCMYVHTVLFPLRFYYIFLFRRFCPDFRGSLVFVTF